MLEKEDERVKQSQSVKFIQSVESPTLYSHFNFPKQEQKMETQPKIQFQISASKIKIPMNGQYLGNNSKYMAPSWNLKMK